MSVYCNHIFGSFYKIINQKYDGHISSILVGHKPPLCSQG